jgi:hypothetical protein
VALIDRGANGCDCGDYMIILEGCEHFYNISGLGVHCENQLWIVTAQALIETHRVFKYQKKEFLMAFYTCKTDVKGSIV